MNGVRGWLRGPAARRYAPLAVVMVVPLLLVLILPSTAPNEQATAAVASGGSPYATVAGGGDGQVASAGGDGGSAPAVAGDGSTGPAANGSSSQAGGSVKGAKGGGPSASNPAGAPVAGGASHCAGSREFDPAIDFFAPPCVAPFSGNNNGATYAGVTGTSIEIVNYYPQGNAAVDTATKAQGLYVSIDQQRQWDAGAQDFINSHYELYGRKVKIETVQGTCSTIPPDPTCLRNEMQSIVASKHPYMFRWITPLTSVPFDELSKLGVVNIGGQMFTDSFSQARRPFHWDLHESGTQIADAFGQWWCAQLSGKPAQFSSAPVAAQGVNGQTRVLGVIGTNDPENIKMRQEVDRVVHGCGSSVAHTYDASNDISTAAAQKSAAIANMRQSPSATTVLCLCNPVGATYVYEEEQQDGYYPENLFAGTVYIDEDDSGQSFMSGSACPASSACEYTNAVGLSSMEPREPTSNDNATRVWKATGRPGGPPFAGASLDWDYYQMMASLLQGAGPTLTPANMEQGAFAAPQRGGGTTGHALRGFAPGSYAWNHDMEIAYWAPNKVSPFNGKKGTYVFTGPRLTLGQYPKGNPPVPAQR